MKDERCLRLIQNEKLSFYEELLEKDASVSIYHRNKPESCYRDALDKA